MYLDIVQGFVSKMFVDTLMFACYCLIICLALDFFTFAFSAKKFRNEACVQGFHVHFCN